MTNLQEGAIRASGQNLRRLWLFTPIAIGGVLTAVVIAAALIPLLAGMRQSSERLRQLEGLSQERGLLRTQLVATAENIRTNEQRQNRILGLISGSGDLSTFLTRLQKEADRTGVRLELYEPQAAAAPSEPTQQPPDGAPQPPPSQQQAQGQPQQQQNQAQGQPQQQQNQAEGQPQQQNQAQGQPQQQGGQPGAPATASGAAPPPTGPPELQGLRRQTSLVTVRGTYPRLLAFMQSLEALNVLVVQSDMNLTLEEGQSGGQAARSGSAFPVTLKFSVSLYDEPQEKTATPVAATAN